jgi:hypothetical protein
VELARPSPAKNLTSPCFPPKDLPRVSFLVAESKGTDRRQRIQSPAKNASAQSNKQATATTEKMQTTMVIATGSITTTVP